MASKQVRDEGKQAAAVIEAARTNAEEIASRRMAQFQAAGVAVTFKASLVAALVRADAERLQAGLDALREADEALDAERSDDAEPLARRDEVAETVRAKLVTYRELVRVTCGDKAVAELGFAGVTPRDPVALEQLASRVIARVARNPPKPRQKGVTFQPAVALDGVAQDAAALARANADVQRERREEQLALARRDEAWAAFDRDRVAVTRSLDAELRAVGLDDVADRLVRAAPSAGADEANEEPADPDAKPADAAPARPAAPPSARQRPSAAPPAG